MSDRGLRRDLQSLLRTGATGEQLQRLLDRYHFGEESAAVEDAWEERDLLQLEGLIEGELHGIDRTTLVKVLGVLRFVARRRTRGRREYLRIVQSFVGGF